MEKLDWEKIALRISTDAERSINYYVPIINNNQPCIKALELSFSREKNIFQATVRTYIAPSSSSSSLSEERRLQTILYNLSIRGLTIPKNVIDREKANQKEFIKDDVASVKNKQMSIAARSTTSYLSTRECKTIVNADFYYVFTLPSNSYSENYNLVSNYFSHQVFTYLTYGKNLDYEVPSYPEYGNPNELTFYNIPDNNALGCIIREALEQAEFSTRSNFNLSYSAITYYNYEVLSSTCAGGVGSGGGIGGGGSGTTTPGGSNGQQTVTVSSNSRQCLSDISAIIESKTGQMFNCIGDIAGMANVLSQVAIGSLYANSTYHITIGEEAIPSTTITDANGNDITTMVNGRTSPLTGNITINSNLLNTATDLAVAGTMIHELMHSYFIYGIKHTTGSEQFFFQEMNQYLYDDQSFPITEQYEVAQHEQMAATYVNSMASVLLAYAHERGIWNSPDSSISLQTYCQDIMWRNLAISQSRIAPPNAIRAKANGDREANNQYGTNKKGCS